MATPAPKRKPPALPPPVPPPDAPPSAAPKLTAPKLTKEQRLTLLTWLAADYDHAAIAAFFDEREWPMVSRATLTHYRKRHAKAIEDLRARRYSEALTTGLALKEERVARLKEHADKLEKLKWVAGKSGKLYNEKAWREVLDDIARETGGRVTRTEIGGPGGGPIPFRQDLTPEDVIAARAAIEAFRATQFPPEEPPNADPPG